MMLFSFLESCSGLGLSLGVLLVSRMHTKVTFSHKFPFLTGFLFCRLRRRSYSI